MPAHAAVNGSGLGASHQTGWTGVIARAMHVFATTSADQVLELGKIAAVTGDKPRKNGQSRNGRASPA